MKKIFFVVAMLLCLASIGQTGSWNINGTLGSPTSAVETKGAHFVRYGLRFMYNYADTTALNTSGLQVFPFTVAIAKDTAWIRNATATRWDKLGAGTSVSVPSLQTVTDVGSRTTNIISAAGLRTNYLAADTNSNADFEIAIFPDLQYMTQTYQSVGRQMFKQTVDSATARNTKAVISVGDLAQTPTSAEMDTASHWFARLDAANIPNIAIVGNHDYNGQAPSARDISIYNTYFNPARYSGSSFYGGHYGSDNANYWIKFNAGTKKYMVLGLEFLPRDAVITWAGALLDSVLAADPSRDVIVTTHAYQSAYGELSVDTTLYTNNTYGMDATSNNGQDLWDKLIKKKKNIKWVFNGHYLINPQQPVQGLAQKMISVGENGNVINQIFVNFQGDHDGGAGYFMRLQFHPSTGLVDVKFYSSLYNAYDTTNPSYTLYDPSIQVGSSMGVAGTTAVNNFRATGDAKFDKLPKFRIPYVGADHILVGTDSLLYNPNDLLQVIGTKVLFGQDSSYYQPNFTGSATSTAVLTVVQPTTTVNTIPYGIAIEKAGNGFDAPRLLFYKTAGANTSIKANTALLNLGDIVWKGIPSDNSTILTGGLIRLTHLESDASHIWTSMLFQIPDKSGTSANAMYWQATSSTDINGYFGGPAVYAANYVSRFTSRSLVDKNYVDSLLGLGISIRVGTTPMVNSRNFRIGYDSSGFFSSNDRWLYNPAVDTISFKHSSASISGIWLHDLSAGFHSQWNGRYGIYFLDNSGNYNSYGTNGITLNNKNLGVFGTSGDELFRGEFYGGLTVNPSGNSHASLRVKSIANDTSFYVDATTGAMKSKSLPSGAGKKAVRYDPSTGAFSYSDTATGSSSGNNLYVRIPKTLSDTIVWAPDSTTLVFKSIDVVSDDSTIVIQKTITDSSLKYRLSLRYDTCAQVSFAGGGGNAGDTASFTTSTIFGSYFNSLTDTIIITNLRIGLQGSSPNVTVTVYWNDSLGVTAGATKLVNAGSAATNVYTGTSVTSFDNNKIPPGVWVWAQTTTVAAKPTYMSSTLIGYKKRRQ